MATLGRPTGPKTIEALKMIASGTSVRQACIISKADQSNLWVLLKKYENAGNDAQMRAMSAHKAIIETHKKTNFSP